MDTFPKHTDTEKQITQQSLREVNDFTNLGNGPGATGGTRGWSMSADLCFRCVVCDYFMPAAPEEYDHCFCRAMSKDASAGRFGSNLSDAQIEVYRVSPKSAVSE